MPRYRTITVLHLVHRFTIGGAEAVVHYLCRHSPSHIQNIVCSFHEPDEAGVSLYGSCAEIICLGKQHGNDFSAIRRLAAIIRNKNIDLVHAQAWATYIEGLMAAKLLVKKKTSFIYAFHGKTIADVENGIPWRRRMAQRVAAGFTDAIVAPSRQMAEDYAATNGLSLRQVQVIYNGIDLSLYGRQFADARSRLAIEKDEFVVGFVGRLDPVKNLDGLFRAFASAVQKITSTGSRQQFRLLVVGGGPALTELQQLARRLSIEQNVSFLGMRNDVGLCLSAMDVYVQPSFYEGHSNTILEAMAAGLPVISTYVGGTPEIIKHEHSGLLFQSDDLDGISNAIFTLWHDKKKRQAIAEAGKRTIKQKFSVETMVKAYDDLFCRLISPSVIENS